MSTDDLSRQSRKYTRLTTLGLNLAAGMAAFSAGGWWIDQKLGGGMAFTVGGMFLGLGYGGYEIWKVIRWLGEDEKAQRPPAPRKENSS